jgi:formylglycine-generating enzyme required for sulfatase activity
MSQVFISYRRDDSADVAGRIHDRLVQKYGADDVVMDVDSIPLGVDFREFLGDAVGRCRVLLVIIGPQWLDIVNRRRDDPLDFVRLEIEAALQRGIPVIPVMVGGAVIPTPDQLPAPLQPLAFRNGLAVRRNPDFHRDVDRLLNSLDRLLPAQPSAPSRSERPSATTAEVRRTGQPPASLNHPKALPQDIVNSLGMKLVRVPRGTFWMGDRGSQTRVEVPQDFYMGIFPVTQGQWQDVMRSNPSYFSRGGGGADKVKDISDADLEQFPVEKVSWEDAQQFLERLNAREKERRFLYRVSTEPEFLYRLPTEAEWEYSCRGAATSQQDCGFEFYLAQPANDLSSAQANFAGNQPAGNAPKGEFLERTTRVGSYKPNRLGIYDMHGNVWEWCETRFDAGGSARVFRGGSWINHGFFCRASSRSRLEPAYRNSDLGFRLAAVPSRR